MADIFRQLWESNFTITVNPPPFITPGQLTISTAVSAFFGLIFTGVPGLLGELKKGREAKRQNREQAHRESLEQELGRERVNREFLKQQLDRERVYREFLEQQLDREQAHRKLLDRKRSREKRLRREQSKYL